MLFHTNEQTDMQTYLTKLIVTFHNFEYVPKKTQQILPSVMVSLMIGELQ